MIKKLCRKKMEVISIGWGELYWQQHMWKFSGCLDHKLNIIHDYDAGLLWTNKETTTQI